MKNIVKIFVVLSFACLAVACHDEDIVKKSLNSTFTEVGVFGDEMRLNLGIVAPDPVEVVSRGVDPDGKALQTLTVFCFDRNGLLISTASAKVKPKVGVEDNTEGTIDVSLPIATRIMHLVGNQNMSRFDKNTFTNKSEDEVLSILEGSAGMLIYWARIEVPTNVNSLYTGAQYEKADGTIGTATDVRRTEPEAVVDWLTIETNAENSRHRGIEGKGYPIILLRNQARFSIESEGWEEFIETNSVTGVTNQPKDEWKGRYFEVTGFAVCNSPAFGTVAPYHTEHGFPTYKWSDFTPYYGVTDGTKGNWRDDETSVTLPARRDKLTDANDVNTARDQFIFETINASTDPVDLILRGYNIDENGKHIGQERYYYRVNIIDEEGEMITIRRNHHYKIHIVDNLTNGCPTFEEALRSPATNNIWFSISDEVKAIRDKEVELSVEKTKIVVDANELEDFYLRMQTIQFQVKTLSDEVTLSREKLKVHWIEDNQQVSSTQNPDFLGDGVTFDTTTGEGLVNFQLLELPEDKEMVKGTLLIKYGRLQRKITVIIVRKQNFIPAWVSSEVYGKLTGEDYQGEHVTVIFNIPETCPKELFPMKVLLTTNGLDGRAASGQTLPIMKKGEDGYGETFTYTVNEGTEYERTLSDLGYKYEYTVTAPGQQRVYFENIFEVAEGSVEYVVLEAPHFEMIAKPVTYVDHQNKILLPKLMTYSAIENATEGESISYILVPQKRFAPISFDIALTVPDGTNLGTVGDNEEFLLYSFNLDHYPDEDSRLNEFTAIKPSDFDCVFQPYDELIWGTGGRVYGFYPRKEKLANNTFWGNPEVINGHSYNLFQIYLETNKPASAEVVRIASNQKGSPSVKTNGGEYLGDTFRSVTFELANYRPFRFAAQINGEGNYVGDDATSGTQEPEIVDGIKFEYLPDEIIEVSFDITSFTATNGVQVTPFGTGFEIFIDAPMLTLQKGDNKGVVLENGWKPVEYDLEDMNVIMFDKRSDGTHYTDNKAKLENLGNGRFVYRVDPNVNVEADCWSNGPYAEKSLPLIKDIGANMNLYGDRKTIRFRKNSIVSSGQIVVSANPEHVTYHSKTFNITNQPIMGKIGYIPEDENGNQLEPVPVPAGQFVSFSRILDDSRIGSLVVKSSNELTPEAPTEYELRLRGEYEFRWTNDPIKVQMQVDGKFYSTIIPDLETLYSGNKVITLALEKQE